MTIRVEHELHKRRFGRNLGVGLALFAFAALVFALSVVKITGPGAASIQGFDHVLRPGLMEAGK